MDILKTSVIPVRSTSLYVVCSVLSLLHPVQHSLQGSCWLQVEMQTGIPPAMHHPQYRVPGAQRRAEYLRKHILRRRRAMSIRAGSTLSASSTPDSAQHHVTLPVSSVQPPNRRTQDDQAVSSGRRDSALSNGALTRSPKHPEQVLNKKTLASSSLAVDPPEPNCIFPVSPLSRSSSFLFSLARSRSATSVVLWCCCSSFL